MKRLITTFILLGSLSAFATGEDRHLTNDAVMCQTELGKTAVEASESVTEDNSTADSL